MTDASSEPSNYIVMFHLYNQQVNLKRFLNNVNLIRTMERARNRRPSSAARACAEPREGTGVEPSTPAAPESDVANETSWRDALFHKDWFAASAPGGDPQSVTMDDYEREGSRARRSPHPLFSIDYYLSQNPEVAEADVNPLRHFVTTGWRSGKDPHPLFHVDFYLSQAPELDALNLDPLTHYVTQGWRRGLRPNRCFDPVWYMSVHQDVRAADIEPLQHYVMYGDREGRKPCEGFDPKLYREANRLAAKANPLEHYLLKLAQGGLADAPERMLASGAEAAGASSCKARATELGQADPPPIENYALYDNYFDPDYYLAQEANIELQLVPEVRKLSRRQAALNHYYLHGWRAGLNPSPYFDVKYYLAINPDIRAAQVDPLTHYIRHGAAEFRNPHPAFDARWYAQTYLAQERAAEPLAHYVTRGWRSGARPNPLFWSDWYAKTYLGSLAGYADPFYHYLSKGQRQHNPNPLFDTSFYCEQYPSREERVDPLSHYIRVGEAAGLRAHSMFDPAHVRSQLPTPPERTLLERVLENDDQLSPHPLFDVDYVRRQVARLVGLEALRRNIVVEYLINPRLAGVDPHPMFSKPYYYQCAGDVRAAGVDAFLHYLRSGKREGRRAHPLFDADHYRATNGLAAGTDPLTHYVTEGFRSGCAPRQGEPPDTTPRPLPPFRTTIEVPDDRVIYPRPESGASRRARIGVFAHIFYPELTQELLDAAANVPGDGAVYVSTDAPVKARTIEEICRAKSKHPFEIRVFPNRGRDIAPFVVGYADRIREVDYGVHVHTKKSTHYAEEFAAWRRYLLRGNLGSTALIENILGLLSDEKIGAYMPEHFAPIKSLIQWGGNFNVIEKLLGMRQEKITREHILDFPSGSMFWFKSKALEPLLDLDLSLHHFDPELGQVDGTLAHAIERSFFYFVETAGYGWAVGKRPSAKTATPVERISRAANRIFPSRRDHGELRAHLPECLRFLARPSRVARPRLNLLIPTVDTKVGYAGVATALDVFHAIRNALGAEFDARLIATDATPSNQYSPPQGYDMADLLEADVERRDLVVDGCARARHPFVVRDDDVFVATAWWTARNAFDLLDQQDRLFGKRKRGMVYLIQDFECGFYPWSTRWGLTEATYRQAARTLPIFNTRMLHDHFVSSGYYESGYVLNPAINAEYAARIDHGRTKEKIVLLYARPHAERNCLSFLDAAVELAVTSDPDFWRDWRFIAIGEDFERDGRLACARIEVRGRLSIGEYAELASCAALGVSLMLSPHPSYPPLEMAAAGVQVITNSFGSRDLGALHENLRSFPAFSPSEAVARLRAVAQAWADDPAIGWSNRAKIDWFFGGRTNLAELAAQVAQELRARDATAAPAAESAHFASMRAASPRTREASAGKKRARA